MTRILLIAAMLLPVASVMAAGVQITADVATTAHDIDGVPHKTVTIGYIATDVNVRAFALDINVDNGMNIGDSPLTGFKTGESTASSKGYGIFPGRFRDFIDPANPNWSDANYSPLTPWNAPGAENTGLGWSSMVVELGTLYSGPNMPDITGTLFAFDVNSEGAPDCNLTIAADALRGGIVGEDANEITATNLPLTVPVVFVVPCTVPNIVGMTKTDAEAAIVAAGLIVGTETGIFSDTTPVNQVTAQDPAPGEVECGTAVNLTYVCRTQTCLTCKGDINNDGWNRTNDIGALVAYVSSLGSPYRAQNTTCGYKPCYDINADGWIRTNDIGALVTRISGLGSPYRCLCASCPP